MKRIESPQNSLFKQWKKLMSTRKERDKTSEFLVEGFHLVEEALKKEGTILTLIVREGTDIPSGWDTEQLQIVELTHDLIKELTDTEHTQGIFAHCRQPEYSEEEQSTWKRVLLIDAVQDPGNVGTMIRTADAAGVDGIVLGKGSADPYNPKTVRSAQGSHFHLPIVKGNMYTWVNRLKASSIPVYGTALKNAVPFHEIEATSQFGLIVGNEGAGIDEELLTMTDQNVTIPILGQAESLNVAVATGVLLFNLTKS
ncbi:TrmH family RNA methyltransferase [Chungangia koreensis]|uniref:TrmH family RNA methyltransferase n=1 Tax=Chungangia koreensis TaxID=752657 RepID=A0ABV8X6X4_9LACT